MINFIAEIVKAEVVSRCGVNVDFVRVEKESSQFAPAFVLAFDGNVTEDSLLIKTEVLRDGKVGVSEYISFVVTQVHNALKETRKL